MIKKNTRKKLREPFIIFLILTLSLSLFWPYAYAIKEPPQTTAKKQKLNMLTYDVSSYTTKKGDSCQNTVETISLNATEYKRLIKAVNNSLIDGFGNIDRMKKQDEYTAADASPNPGVNEAKNQFITTAEGKPAFLFDSMQFGATPSTQETCYLNNIITKGRISYDMKVDQNIRFCSEYGDKACDNGMYDLTQVPEDLKKIKDIQEFENNFYNEDRTLKTYDEVKWDDLSEDYSTLKKESTGLKSYDDFKTSCQNNIGDCINELDSTFQAAIPSTKTRGYWNIVESNHTDLGVYQFDYLIALPHNLALYIKDLNDLSTGENIVLGINIASMIVGGANAIKGLSALKSSAKLTKKALEEGKMEKQAVKALTAFEKRADDFEEAEEIASKMEKISQNSKEFELTVKDTSVLKKLDPLKNWKKVKKIDVLEANMGENGEWIPTKLGAYDKDGKMLFKIKGKDLLSTKKIEEIYGINKDEVNLLKKMNNEIANGGMDVSEIIKGEDGAKAYALTKKAFTFESKLGSAEYLTRMAAAAKKVGGFSREGAGSLLKYLTIQWALNFNNFLKFERFQAYITLAAQKFGENPKPFYQLQSVLFLLRPARSVTKGEPSYVDIIRTTRNGLALNGQIFPDDFFTNIMDYLGVSVKDITGEAATEQAITRKITNIGEIVSIIDQENAAESLTDAKAPVNILTSVNISNDNKRWLINSLNPDTTSYYGFEDPRAYQTAGQEKYTAMGLISNNVNISGMTSVEKDWAQYGPEANMLMKILPSTKSVIMMGSLTSAMAPLSFSGFKASTVRLGLQLLVTKYMGEEFTSQIVSQTKYGQMVDINKAFEEGKRCEDEEKRIMKDVVFYLWAKGITASINMGLELADVALSPTVVGSAISMGLQIANGIADYYVSEQYDRAKADGLKSMKNCYETQFEYLAWQTVPTEQGQQTEIEKAISDTPVQNFAKQLGVNLNALSPEVGQQIEKLAQNIYSSTLSVSATQIKGKSMIRMLGTTAYQVHFAPTAKFQWYAEDQCKINFCTKTPDGNYKCISKQGYQLLDENNNVIIEGPQAEFMQWNDLETYASIPQRVIAYTQTDSPLMKITSTDTGTAINFENKCIKNEVAKEVGTTVDDDDTLSTIMGNLETIVTPEAMIWFDGNSLAVTYLTSKTCGTGDSKITYSQGQTIRNDDGQIEIMRNGKIKLLNKDGIQIGGENCQYDVGQEGAIAFDNGIIMQSKASGNNAYTKLNGKRLTYLVIRDLLTFDSSSLESMKINAPCDCVEGTEGLSCDLNDKGDKGVYFGFKMQGEIGAEKTQQLNNELDSICFTKGTGQNGEQFSYDNGTFCMTDANGKEECNEVKSIDDNGLNLDDGGRWQVEKGPEGPQWVRYDSNNQQVGNPIPIMWLNGLGGSMYNNPETGRISIKNEFPFAINPSFHQIGALANGGFATPAAPAWGTKVNTAPGQTNYNKEKPSVMAQLPGLPENPYWMTVFIITLIASLMIIRIKYSEEEIKKMIKKQEQEKK